ncbi:succinylglutamate desuccinylase/aspartoacylase family protein [Cognatishimia sp. F0-27]|uniref:succinylglutamate desuccinylase/aspartoacylase family protein n=1 Tax=Cognatishimia sp. F0-27 TaxID=2816855 RepID=UPI001D0CA561|nr:succinylglutamate desuccinylase/aspartoacylase family protein [Cognatishimia sp. F0-27]MCC1493891.1 succinylglutamate desuccinylase/aspartoacylase family protein [Cognatishimia sp. F0-27]
MSNTLITCEIDFDAQGKQSGYLRVPHSTHRSGYGWLPVPITVLSNGEGPTLVLSAGVHGDEYEGQIAVASLARDLEADAIRGRLILLPMVNAPAAEAGLRVSPIDDGNLNRLYPGNPRGTPSEMIAHFHEAEILSRADYAVDLHSGGSSMIYPPTLLRGPAHSPEEARGLDLLTQAFDLPYAWVFTGGGGRSSTARTAMGAANRNGVINVMAELGGGGCVQVDVLKRCARGLLRIMHALGMLPDYAPDPAEGTRMLNAKGLVPAYEAGVFEPLKTIGSEVSVGEPVARIHHPETPGRPFDTVQSQLAGVVLSMRSRAELRRGDALFQIAEDVI